MSRDPVSGNILFAWQDARDQKDQAEVNTFITVWTKAELDKLPRKPKCDGFCKTKVHTTQVTHGENKLVAPFGRMGLKRFLKNNS